MNRSELTKLVKQFGGWWEGDTARFSTPYEKAQFLKAYSSLEEPDTPIEPGEHSEVLAALEAHNTGEEE